MKFSQIVQLAALLPFVANARLFSNKKDPRDLQAAEIHNTTSCNPCHRLDIANELFSSLPPAHTVFAEELAFTSEAWNAGEDTWATVEEWDDLTDEQREAAQHLFGCHTAEEWECVPAEETVGYILQAPTTNGTLNPCTDSYFYFGFEELTDDCKNAAKLLNYTASTWDADLDTYHTLMSNWTDLTMDQQAAVVHLGCPNTNTQASWDEFGFEEHDMVTSSAPAH